MPEYRILTLPGGEPNGGTLHPAIVYDDRDLVLCDAGLPGQIADLSAQLGLHGFAVGDVTKVVISHHDHDHVGSLAEIKRANPDIEVIAHALEAPFVAGERRSLRLQQAEAHMRGLSGEPLESGMRFCAYLASVEPCGVDTLVEAHGSEIVPGLTTWNAPGHTPGHVSLFLEEQRVVIAGDALAVMDGRLGLANPQFTLDLDRAHDSASAILAANPRRIVCYHGGEVDPMTQLNADLESR